MRIDENYSTLDLTNEYFKIYARKEDTTILQFNNTAIKLDNKSFEELKDQIMLSEELSGSLKMFQRACDKPSKGTILKELMKTIDKIEALDKESEELYEKEFGALVVEKPYPSQREIFELKLKGQPLIRKMESLKYYKEKLEAQLKYGELQ